MYDPEKDVWELYYLPDDFSQARDLAAQHPDKLTELRPSATEPPAEATGESTFPGPGDGGFIGPKNRARTRHEPSIHPPIALTTSPASAPSPGD